jgi:FAD/FMN-containing dehydrogenase
MDAENYGWVDATWAAIRDYGQGVYSNFLEDEGEARLREAYHAATWERLAEVKRRYDPTNVFNRTQNIPPARLVAAA